MKPEAQQIEELKSILEKENGRPFSVEEATEAHRSTETLLRIIVDGIFEEIERKQKLETSPEGFHLDDGRACVICGQPAIKENSWYDKNGIKCMSCQKALNKKIDPCFNH